MFDIEVTGEGPKKIITLFDRSAKTHVRVAPNLGFSCFSFVVPIGTSGETCDLLYAGDEWPDPEARATHHGIPILAPFPNRIRVGRYAYDGREYTLPLNEHGRNAIHGFCIDKAWTCTHGTDSNGAWIRGEFRLSREAPERMSLWPADFELVVTYRMAGLKLECDIEVSNPDTKPLPFGFGTHPYFRFDQSSACRWRVPVHRQVELDNCLPTGKIVNIEGIASELATGLPLDARKFDDVMTDLEIAPSASARGSQVVSEVTDTERKIGIRQSFDPKFGFIVLFTPVHGKAVCIEPYTCGTDAINMSLRDYTPGMWRLEPGERKNLWIDLEAFTL